MGQEARLAASGRVPSHWELQADGRLPTLGAHALGGSYLLCR